MEQFFSQVPTTITGWVVTILFVAGAVAFWFSKIRQADMKILREANKDLRDSIEDKGKEIAVTQAQVSILIEKVSLLEKRNKTLEDLVITALKQYFFENPKVAKGMQEAIIS